jgi:hypothetical protein
LFVQQELQCRINMAAAAHPCCQLVTAGDGMDLLDRVRVRPVIYHELGLAVEIQVPTWRCGVCSELWEASACDAHCFPSSPVEPAIWVDLVMLDIFRHLSINGGLSMTVYSDMAGKVRAATAEGQPPPGMATRHDLSAHVVLQPVHAPFVASFGQRTSSSNMSHCSVKNCLILMQAAARFLL